MMHMLTMINGNDGGEVLCGLYTNCANGIKAIRQFVPIIPSFEIVGKSPTRILLRHTEEKKMFFMIRNIKKDCKSGDVVHVVTKKNAYNTEDIWCVYDKYSEAEEFINRELDVDYVGFKNDNIRVFSGITPFRRIIGDDNPELNRKTFYVYSIKIND